MTRWPRFETDWDRFLSHVRPEGECLLWTVNETQKKGTLTLTLTVEPTKGMDNLTVSANCKVVLPTEQQASIFFATDEGQLTRHDPRQIEAPLAAVGTARRGEIA